MEQKAKSFLKALLSKSQREGQLLRYLSPELRLELEGAATSQQCEPANMFSMSQWLQPIHYSWLAQAIQEYAKPIQPLLLGALPQAQATGVHSMLSLDAAKTASSTFLRPYLLGLLRDVVEEPGLLHEELLPPSQLNCLLKLKRKYLLSMVDLLGLHDLASDLRLVIDKALLNRIHAALSPQELQFLHYFSKQSSKWASPKLGLSGWDGSKQQLHRLLHYRGLLRMSRAVFEETPSFKWHLLHRMDTGRAKIIKKEFYKKQDPALFSYFRNQVLYLAKKFEQV